MNSHISYQTKQLRKLLKNQSLSFYNSLDWREIKTQIGSKDTNSLQANFMRHVCNDEEFEKWREKMQAERLEQREQEMIKEERRAQEKIDQEAHERKTAGGWSGTMTPFRARACRVLDNFSHWLALRNWQFSFRHSNLGQTFHIKLKRY